MEDAGLYIYVYSVTFTPGLTRPILRLGHVARKDGRISASSHTELARRRMSRSVYFKPWHALFWLTCSTIFALSRSRLTLTCLSSARERSFSISVYDD